jgi:hypothetical protein
MQMLLISSFLCGSTGCFAYTHTIINATTYKIDVKLIYEGNCQSNRRISPLVIESGATYDFDVHCPLLGISGSIVVDQEDDTALRSSSFWRAPEGRFLGDGTWKLTELDKCYVLNMFTMCKFAIKKIK